MQTEINYLKSCIIEIEPIAKTDWRNPAEPILVGMKRRFCINPYFMA